MKIETAREIKKLRDELDLTQEQLAQLIGVTGRSVSRWESGDTEPTPVARKAARRWMHLLEDLKQTFEEEALKEWFHQPNDFLGGKTPYEVSCEIGGENKLHDLLERTDWGIPG